MAKISLNYLIVSIVLALLGGVYEVFSHGVYSNFMIYAFAFPLVLGTLPYSIISYSGIRKTPNLISRNFCHIGTAVLSVGSAVKGALDIYGTSNSLVPIYFYAGGLLFVIGAVMFMMSGRKSESGDGEN